jgi:predicted Zn finger-like uncharacterized protein
MAGDFEIIIFCPECREKFMVWRSEIVATKKVTCPHCDHVIDLSRCMLSNEGITDKDLKHIPKVVMIPVVGSTPGPYPFPKEEYKEQEVAISEADLGESVNRYCFALESTGFAARRNQGERSYLIIESGAEVKSGRNYVVCDRDQVLYGGVKVEGGKIDFLPYDIESVSWEVNDKDILGRVIYSGIWKEDVTD